MIEYTYISDSKFDVFESETGDEKFTLVDLIDVRPFYSMKLYEKNSLFIVFVNL